VNLIMAPTCSTGADESPLPRGKPWRLVGAAGLSWHADTREAFPTLQPPDDAGYLSNIAIESRFRRCGCQMFLCISALARVLSHPVS